MELLGSQAHRPVPGKLLPRSIQFGIALAPRLPHRVHRMCRVNDGTGTSSGQASTLTSVLLPQARQVAKSERTPRLRMLPSVIGPIGSSERGIGRHSIGSQHQWLRKSRDCHRAASASAFRPAALILIRPTSIILRPARTFSAVRVARPWLTSPAIKLASKPCEKETSLVA